MARKTLIGADAEKQKAESGKRKKAGKTARRGTADTAVAQSQIDNRKSTIPNAARIETIAIERLRPAAYNPRKALKPGDPEFEKLKRSIEQFGLCDPPIWNVRTGNLVGGHQRLSVLRHMHPELRELAVSVVDLDENAEKALNVALNKIEGGWDQEKLTDLLRELQMEADATVTGFDQVEIDAMLAELAGHGAGEGGDTSPQLGEMEYRVVVDCKNEVHQREMLERFAKEALPCRALIS